MIQTDLVPQDENPLSSTVSIIQVAIPSPLQRHFDYLAKPHLLIQLQPGMRIKVPFSSRSVIGIVLDVTQAPPLHTKKLRYIEKILDPAPVFNSTLMQLLIWASQYYQYPIGEVLHQAMPTLLRHQESITLDSDIVWQATEAGKNINSLRAPKQKALLTLLLNHPDGLAETQLRLKGFERRVWQQLFEKRYIEQTRVSAAPSISPQRTEERLVLNPDQEAAVNTIHNQLNTFQCFLLQGVTGSGKTEVYLQALEAVLATGKQALVLVPEIALTPQTVQRFAQRFSVSIGILHSGLTDKERYKTSQAAQDGTDRLIIGTRSAIFTDFKNLGMIIIDEEHDNSFKQQDNFRYSARDLAIRRAQIENIPIILGSATPSLESLYNAERNRYHLLTLPERAGSARKPTFHLVDMRKQPLQAGLTASVLTTIRQHLAQDNQVLLFLNRRGYATALLCHDCGWIAECSRCAVSFIFHQQTQCLHCHHCGAKKLLLKSCGGCQGKQLQLIGMGTERLDLELTELFSADKIIRMDRDTTRRKGSISKKLAAIQNGGGKLLIGTQLLAKGHHFPNVTLVVILNADQGLFSTDFRATERVGQLITQVAGRAGRADKPGTVLIQTYQPDNVLLRTLTQQGYLEFSHKLLEERQQAHLPPFSFLALIRAESVHATIAEAFLQQVLALCHTLADKKNTIDFLGPIPAPMAKRAGKHRFQLLLRATQRQDLQKFLQPLRLALESLKTANKVRWSIDVDPQDTF